VWRITRDAFDLRAAPIGRAALAELVSRLRQQAGDPASGPRYRDLAQQLYEQLFGTMSTGSRSGDQLIIVADPLTASVPFAVLIPPGSNRHLVQDRAIVVVPSGQSLLRATARLASDGSTRGAPLLIGNPATTMTPLPWAEVEIDALERIYPGAITLRGAAATPDAAGRLLQTAGILHFGGHAIANGRYPRLSFLQLAGTREAAQSPLTAGALAEIPMSQLRLAVLAACDSAGGSTEPGSPAFGIANAFLAAGVPNVIGSLWNIDDRVTSDLVIAFHNGYARGRPAADALRQAQLQVLSGKGASFQHPYYWAGLQAYGGISPNP
jgi:CHAT domain-containing protein